MLRQETIAQCPRLQKYQWPPVNATNNIDIKLLKFINLTLAEQQSQLSNYYINNSYIYGNFIHTILAHIYSYIYGYPDSLLFLQTNIELEISLLRTKLVIEEDFLNRLMMNVKIPEILNQQQAFAYLNDLKDNNTGVYHPFFDYIRNEINAYNINEFLLMEVIRNEVVDDEVALAVAGLQGQMKQVMASNLWDECGCGDMKNFHTYWLRRLLEHSNQWDKIIHYRVSAPWFIKLTSNLFNAFLTRPAYKYRAYGAFLIMESWVAPHFERIIAGLQRTGLTHHELNIYFDKHYRIDPNHAEQLLNALFHQKPELTTEEVREVLIGAHAAITAGTLMFDNLLQHFSQ